MPQPRIPGVSRPPPPAELSPREREIWIDIVDSRPLHYFGRETFPMLAALCMHAAQAELLAAELRRNSTQKNRDEHRKQTAMNRHPGHPPAAQQAWPQEQPGEGGARGERRAQAAFVAGDIGRARALRPGSRAPSQSRPLP